MSEPTYKQIAEMAEALGRAEALHGVSTDRKSVV